MANKCKILYNTQGERVGVQEMDSNRPSQTFQDILNDPHTKNFDEALQIYKNLYSEDIKFSIIGEKGASQIEEYQKTLNEAKKLDEQGVNIDVIQKQTGWYKAKDGWKKLSPKAIKDFKIESNKINQIQTLKETLKDGNILFEMYPTLGEYSVVFVDATKEDKPKNLPQDIELSNGAYDEASRTIFINTVYNEVQRTVQAQTYTLAHEVQHILQQIEGFSKGGSSYSMLDEVVKLLNIKGEPSFQEIYNKAFKADLSKFSENEVKIISQIGATLNAMVENNSTFLKNQYKHILGEIDANVVEGALKIRDSSGIISASYKDLLDFYIQGFKINPDSIVLLSNGDINFSLVGGNYTDPTLKYQTEEGNIYTSYAEALRNTNGSEVKAGFNTTKGFKEFHSTSTNTSVGTQEGLINHLIKTGTLSGVSYKENGKIHLIPQGKTKYKQKVNAEIAKEAFKKQLGIKSSSVKGDNSILVEQDNQRDRVTLTTKNGEEKTIKLSDLEKKSIKELKKDFDIITIGSAIAHDAFNKEMLGGKTYKSTDFIPENELQEKIKNLLNKIGIKTLSFEDYSDRHNKRNSLPLDARALIDLTNKVMAFKDGIIENDDLIEETAHLIESSIPMEQKANVLRNIHKTKEWGQYAEQYRGVYATDEDLRREILGKIIANAIKENFESRNQNITEDSIIAKIKEFFNNFFQRIKDYFKEDYQKELDKLNQEVYRNLINETLDIDLKGVNGIFFSNEASSNANKMVEQANKLVNILKEQEKLLSKKFNNPANKAYIKNIEKLLEGVEPIITTEMTEEAKKEAIALAKKLDEAEKISGIAEFIKLISSQVNVLTASINSKTEDELPFNAEERVVYKSLVDRFQPALGAIENLLNTDNNKQESIKKELQRELRNAPQKTDSILKSIKDAENRIKIQENIKSESKLISDKIRELDAKAKEKIKPSILAIAKKTVDSYDMSEKDAKEFMTVVEVSLSGIQKDTDILHAHLGSLLMARNPLLNMAGQVNKRVFLQQNETFQKSWKKVVNTLGKLNWNNSMWSQIIDTKTNTIINQVSLEKEDLAHKQQIIESLNEALAGVKEFNPKEKFEFIDRNIEPDFEKWYAESTTEDRSVILQNLEENFKHILNKKIRDRKENYFQKEYQEKRDNHIIRIAGEVRDVSSSAKELEAEFRNELAQIKRNAGITLTKEDDARKKEIDKRRLDASNPRSSIDGKLLQGIKEVYDIELEKYVVIKDKEQYDKLSSQERENIDTILGLNYIQYKKADFFKKNNPNSGEITQSFLDALDSAENPLEFLESNAYISFPDSYYEQFTGTSEKLRNLGTEEATELVEDIRNQQSIINNILRVNSEYNRPGETNFVEMNNTQKKEVLLAQMELENLYTKAKGILPKEDNTEEIDAQTKPTDNYFNWLEDIGVEQYSDRELAFIAEHITNSSKRSIESLQNTIRTGVESKLSKRIFEGLTSDEQKQQAVVEYGRTKLLPYLKKTEPVDYSEEFQKVKNGTLSVKEWIKRTDLVKVNPSFSFYENDNIINPKWKANNEAGKEQWTEQWMEKVKDPRYEAIMSNPTLKDGYEAIMEYYDFHIENNNLTGRQSRYMLPGVRATKTQRVASMTADGIKETFMDALQFRAEEQVQGTVNNNSLYSIPTYYTQPLEKESEQTKDYLYAFAVYGQAASQHKARRDNIADMFLIQDALTNVEGQGKNTLKMFGNFMDYNFYGKREGFSHEVKIGNRTIDVGKILITLNNFAKSTNIMGIVTPLTSAAQSATQKFMERVVGEIVDNTSANIGDKYYMLHAGAAAKEAMGLQSNAVINVLGEALGMYNSVHRFENSQLGKVGRFVTNANSKFHEMGNFPVIPRVMFMTIASYRYVDGKIMHYNTFKDKLNSENFKGSVQGEWKKQPLFIDDFISAVRDGVLDFSHSDFIKTMQSRVDSGQLKIPENMTLESYLEDIKEKISMRTLSAINRIDSQVPQDERSIAVRNSMSNFFLTHISWLLSAAPRKLKNRSFNYSEGVFQEGSWRTTANFINKVAFNPKGIKEAYAQLDEAQKKNLKRTIVELGFANALALVALMMAHYDDEQDDPNYVIALMDLFANRVANEQIGSTVGIISGISGVLDNPIMLKNKIQDWANVARLGGERDEQIKYLKSIVPFMQDITKLIDPVKTRQTYMFFNNEKTGLFKKYAWITNLTEE